MKHLGMAYNIQKRNKMAKGGAAHCAHGGPAYCNMGCYEEGGEIDTTNEKLHPKHMPKKMASGGMVDNAEEAMDKAKSYEMEMDEKENEMPNEPRLEMPHSMDSVEAEDEGDMEYKKNTPMKMARDGMFHPKHMAKMIMMAKGGMIDSEEAMEAGQRRTNAIEDHSGGGMDNEDIDLYQTTPHDDNLSDEGEYPLMEEEGYEEGHQAKSRRKGGVLERVMAKIHAR